MKIEIRFSPLNSTQVERNNDNYTFIEMSDYDNKDGNSRLNHISARNTGTKKPADDSTLALSQIISNKSSRKHERVYAGRRNICTHIGSSTNSESSVPPLFSICIRYISKNINGIIFSFYHQIGSLNIFLLNI